MGNYEYFRKIETNGNLLILCQTTCMTSIDRTTPGAKMATCERDFDC